MDENNKITPEAEGPTGFDSVENITSSQNGNFNPTPMFSGMNSGRKEGYTVTPDGGFYEKPEEALENTVGENSNPQPEALNDTASKSDADTSGDANADKVSSPVASESSKASADTLPDFMPSGTYSYSAAKGNLPNGAYQKAEFNPPEAEVPPTVNTVFADIFSNENTGYTPTDPSDNSKNKKQKKYGFGVILTSIILSALIGAGGAIGTMLYINKTNDTQDVVSTASNTTQQAVTNITVDETVNSSIEAVAKKAGPSIIGIRTTAAVTSFFGGSSEATEEGSGIIYTTDGYIITNYHVIQSAVESSNSKVEVFLPEDTDTALEATVIGYNIASDLAVVKVNKTGLPAIEFADSDKLNVGQYAIAIGNPGGLEFIGSVSYGVISGLNRSVTVGTGSTMSLIQTDAAINPGNSGGALVDITGQLIGVNSVKLVSESYEGMGFAIPSNTVKEICDNIIAKQNEPTPYIGIQISQSYTENQLTALGYPAGAVVVSVVEGGPASESGIQRGDIITEFNGAKISNYTDLDNAIANCEPGTSVTVKLYRAGRFYSTNVNVEANNAQ